MVWTSVSLIDRFPCKHLVPQISKRMDVREFIRDDAEYDKNTAFIVDCRKL